MRGVIRSRMGCVYLIKLIAIYVHHSVHHHTPPKTPHVELHTRDMLLLLLAQVQHKDYLKSNFTGSQAYKQLAQ